MKKILLLLALAIIISCSLDTFKSENLASWSINLDFPLFKTEYTVGEMLKDYDELGVEQYGNTNDSIYVFNVSTPHDIFVPSYIITKVGNSVVPIPVPVADYDLEIPTLPDELDGINFVDVDLTLEVDLSQFNVSLADSVIVNTLILTAMNDDGDIATATITNQDILIDSVLVIDDPKDLINIRSEIVTISGDITIYPSDQEGEWVPDQIIVLTSNLHAPLILEITETATFSTPPEKVEIEVDNQIFEKITIFAEIDNQMEIGGKLQILVSPDTMNFEENSPIAPDVLLSFNLLPNQFQVETIELGQDKFDLFADSTYMKVLLNLIGNTDAQGNIIPTRFFTNDSIKVLLYSSAEILIDPQNMGDEE